MFNGYYRALKFLCWWSQAPNLGGKWWNWTCHQTAKRVIWTQKWTINLSVILAFRASTFKIFELIRKLNRIQMWSTIILEYFTKQKHLSPIFIFFRVRFVSAKGHGQRYFVYEVPLSVSARYKAVSWCEANKLFNYFVEIDSVLFLRFVQWWSSGTNPICSTFCSPWNGFRSGF